MSQQFTRIGFGPRGGVTRDVDRILMRGVADRLRLGLRGRCRRAWSRGKGDSASATSRKSSHTQKCRQHHSYPDPEMKPAIAEVEATLCQRNSYLNRRIGRSITRYAAWNQYRQVTAGGARETRSFCNSSLVILS